MFFSQPFRVTRREADALAAIVAMECTRGFPKAWPGRFLVRCRAELNAREFVFAITVRNSGDEPMPAAIAWHPHFRIPSGDRRQARLRIPACGRVVVDNYDNLFPAGEIAPVANTPFAPGIWRGGIPG